MPTLVGSSGGDVAGCSEWSNLVGRKWAWPTFLPFTRNNWVIGTQLLSIFPKTNVSQQVSVCSVCAATAPLLVFRIRISMNISYRCLINNTNYAAQRRPLCLCLAMLLFSFPFLKPLRRNRNYWTKNKQRTTWAPSGDRKVIHFDLAHGVTTSL